MFAMPGGVNYLPIGQIKMWILLENILIYNLVFQFFIIDIDLFEGREPVVHD